tara:strand:+ start:508 stop:684 length:177 start_codon:yes stop_codon:yes gene_type:complete
MSADYQTLLEMWRSEKQKRQKAEDKIKELERRVTEVEEDNKKLAKQVEDLIIPRKHGM